MSMIKTGRQIIKKLEIGYKYRPILKEFGPRSTKKNLDLSFYSVGIGRRCRLSLSSLSISQSLFPAKNMDFSMV